MKRWMVIDNDLSFELYLITWGLLLNEVTKSLVDCPCSCEKSSVRGDALHHQLRGVIMNQFSHDY